MGKQIRTNPMYITEKREMPDMKGTQVATAPKKEPAPAESAANPPVPAAAVTKSAGPNPAPPDPFAEFADPVPKPSPDREKEADSLQESAALAWRSGNLKKALEDARHCLELRREIYGDPRHPKVVETEEMLQEGMHFARFHYQQAGSGVSARAE